MYLPGCFPPRAECRCDMRFRSEIRTLKRMAPCTGTTAYFAVSSAAAWDVSWNRSHEFSGGEHAQQRPARTDPSLVLRRTLESRHHRAGTRIAPEHRPPCAGYRAVQSCQGASSLGDRPLRRVHRSDLAALSPAACHAYLPDDPGARLYRKRGAVATRGGSPATGSPGAFSATTLFPGRAGTSGLGSFRRSPGRPCPSASVLLSDHAFLLARPVSGILLRSKYGKLSAWPYPRVSRLVGPTANPFVR